MFLRPFARAYHSSHHKNPENITNISHKILSIALNKYVPTHGFKDESILRAATDLNYPQSTILSVFENDPVTSLVNYNLSSKRLLLSQFHQEVFEEDKSKMMKNLITKRLLLNVPILPHLSSLLSLMILPQNVTQSVEELLKLADEFQFLCGDQSNDFSWYTKRLGVATIYVQSELHMLKSTPKENPADISRTIRFLNERVDEMEKLGGAYNDVEEWSVFTLASTVNLIKSQLARG